MKLLELDRQKRGFIRERIVGHRDTFDVENVRDFIDVCLKAKKDGDETGALTGKYNVILTVNFSSLKYTVVLAIFHSNNFQSTIIASSAFLLLTVLWKFIG